MVVRRIVDAVVALPSDAGIAVGDAFDGGPRVVGVGPGPDHLAARRARPGAADLVAGVHADGRPAPLDARRCCDGGTHGRVGVAVAPRRRTLYRHGPCVRSAPQRQQQTGDCESDLSHRSPPIRSTPAVDLQPTPELSASKGYLRAQLSVSTLRKFSTAPPRRLRPVPRRFGYSRWDGTQVGFELDADDVLAELTDDLLYHGDLNAALRRLLQSGFRDRNEERIAGMRELLERLRRRRREELERHDLGGVYDDVAERLRDVVDTEREGIDRLVDEARASGDERRTQITEEVAAERRMQLGLLPPDLAGTVRALQEYEFTSTEAREQFDALLQELRQELLQSWFNRMAGAMSATTPEQLQRTKDMFDALSRLLEMREAGVDTAPEFERFMQQYGD